MERIIKELRGHSGAKVELIDRDGKIFVRKEGDIERNVERLITLGDMIPLPSIYSFDGHVLEMEYIHGQDMKSYLTYNNTEDIISFLSDTIDKFKRTGGNVFKDYTDTYVEMLEWTNYLEPQDELPFTSDHLIQHLPRYFPQTDYHGDMTLENIIYSTKRKGFVFIDPVTTKYDSWVFDLAKLRQDIDCKWFLRHSNDIQLNVKLTDISTVLKDVYKSAFDDTLLILMLLRVYRHCVPDTYEYYFIKREIGRLWSSCM